MSVTWAFNIATENASDERTDGHSQFYRVSVSRSICLVQYLFNCFVLCFFPISIPFFIIGSTSVLYRTRIPECTQRLTENRSTTKHNKQNIANKTAGFLVSSTSLVFFFFFFSSLLLLRSPFFVCCCFFWSSLVQSFITACLPYKCTTEISMCGLAVVYFNKHLGKILIVSLNFVSVS